MFVTSESRAIVALDQCLESCGSRRVAGFGTSEQGEQLVDGELFAGQQGNDSHPIGIDDELVELLTQKIMGFDSEFWPLT